MVNAAPFNQSLHSKLIAQGYYRERVPMSVEDTCTEYQKMPDVIPEHDLYASAGEHVIVVEDGSIAWREPRDIFFEIWAEQVGMFSYSHEQEA